MSRHFTWLLILTLFLFCPIAAADNSQGFWGEGKSFQKPYEKETGQPQKPEGGILLSGDCSDYEDLSGLPLPISVGGSTVGAANDYGPFPSRPDCWQGPWYAGSGGGPDVTFKWTAPASGYYTLEVCNSDYDSDILLYNFTCPDEPIYPDDFICGNDWSFCPVWGVMYAGGLQSILLDEGQEVLVVVDGYGNNSGNFELAIYVGDPPPPPFECPENTIFSQPASSPLDPAWLYNSDLQVASRLYDNLPDLSGAICQISFWGFDMYLSDVWHECEEDPMSFDVIFYEDDGGYPGAMVCSRSITPTRTPTGVFYGGSELNYYEGVLDPCCEVDGGWISIWGTSYGGDPQDCVFLWLDSQEGDDLCYRWDGSQFIDEGTSMSLCLAGVESNVPTLSEWGMLIMALLLLTVGTVAVVRRRKAALSRTL